MKYSIKPEEHELREARNSVEKIIESCKYVLEKEDNLSLNLGYADKEETGEFGAYGAARTSDTAHIYFNTEIEGWKDDIEHLTADIYGQSWFYENSEITFKWQQALASITGLILIEEIFESRDLEMENLQKEWAEKKTEIDEKVSADNPENLSWQLKAAIGRKLQEEYKIEEFPQLTRSDILEAGDSLFP